MAYVINDSDNYFSDTDQCNIFKLNEHVQVKGVATAKICNEVKGVQLENKQRNTTDSMKTAMIEVQPD